MNYTYEVMQQVTGQAIKRTDSEGKECWIPTDPANSDYQEYLAQLESDK
jgi:hypothetical protein